MGMILGKIDVEQYAFEKLGTVGVAELRRCQRPSSRWRRRDNTHSEASNGTFRQLAQYIGVFGVPANAARSQIAMTAPVVNAPRKIAMTAPVVSAAATMALAAGVHPAVEDAPAPTDPLVSLRAVGSRTMAALTFSGSAGNAVAEGQGAPASARRGQAAHRGGRGDAVRAGALQPAVYAARCARMRS